MTTDYRYARAFNMAVGRSGDFGLEDLAKLRAPAKAVFVSAYDEDGKPSGFKTIDDVTNIQLREQINEKLTFLGGELVEVEHGDPHPSITERKQASERRMLQRTGRSTASAAEKAATPVKKAAKKATPAKKAATKKG